MSGTQTATLGLVLTAIILIAIAPHIWNHMNLSPVITTTKTETTTTTKTVVTTTTKATTETKTKYVPLINYTTITITSPVPLCNISVTTIPVTTSLIQHKTLTKTTTTTVTTTTIVNNLRAVDKNYALTALSNAKKSVYAYITYYNGYVIWDSRFETLLNKLTQLAQQGLDVKILINKPMVCPEYGGPGIWPKITALIDNINKTLGYKHVRTVFDISPFTLPLIGDEAILIIDNQTTIVMNVHDTDFIVNNTPQTTINEFLNAWKELAVAWDKCSPM